MSKLKPGEVFPSPTVKQVIFQIRFPTLLFLEQKMGDLQLKVMERFPETSISIQRHAFFASMPTEDLLKNLPNDSFDATKIWSFKSKDGLDLQVRLDQVSLVCEQYKSYNTEEPKFRGAIEFVMEQVKAITSLPFVQRVSLRYSNLCPIPSLTSDDLKKYLFTTLPVDRFPVERAKEMGNRVIQELGENRLLIYQEQVRLEQPAPTVSIDLDAIAIDVAIDKVLSTTDDLYTEVHKQFEDTITEATVELMRQPKKE